jgi:hypothetical protein
VRYADGVPRDKDAYNAYMREYMLARYHKRRAEAVVLLGGKCVDCDSTSDLEFDHVDPEDKSFDIAKIWSYTEARFLAELSKCQLRCYGCHKARTSRQRSVEHGGGLTGKHRCRCDLCRARKGEYDRNYHKSRRRGAAATLR